MQYKSTNKRVKYKRPWVSKTWVVDKYGKIKEVNYTGITTGKYKSKNTENSVLYKNIIEQPQYEDLKLTGKLAFGPYKNKTVLELIYINRKYLQDLIPNNPHLFSSLCQKYINNLLPLPNVYS